MANLTIAVPDDLLRQARQRAVGQGTSVNAVLRDYLARYAGVDARQLDATQQLLALARKSRSGRGRATWTRDELHRE
jgi:hypothetical protein